MLRYFGAITLLFRSNAHDLGVIDVNLLRIILASTIALTVSACGGSGISNVPVVGKMFGGEEKTAAQNAWAPTKPQTPVTRAIQVAWTAMRAQKCGFNFNAQALRSSFLQAESSKNPDPAGLTKAQTAYDYTAKDIAARIGPEQEYCSQGRVRKIKSDLKRHLAGDFSAPIKIKKAKVAYENENERPPADAGELFGRHWED